MRNNRKRTGKPTAEPAPSPAAQITVHPSLSYVVPTEFVDLPSKGMFYLEGHPLHEQSFVEIKFMTAKEEDILSSQSMLEKGIAIKRLLQSILVDKEINVDTLLTCDVDAILLAARVSAYGSSYDASVLCNNCYQNIDFSDNNFFDFRRTIFFNNQFSLLYWLPVPNSRIDIINFGAFKKLIFSNEM